ncbi:MAG: hypothetical protein ACXV5J_04130 [Candidatus Angelobacter sp.]
MDKRLKVVSAAMAGPPLKSVEEAPKFGFESLPIRQGLQALRGINNLFDFLEISWNLKQRWIQRTFHKFDHFRL